MFRVMINDEVVELVLSVDRDGNAEGYQLEGPVDYNGHLHGVTPEGHRFCLPRVVDSVALTPEAICPDVPVGLGEGFAAFWKETADAVQ